MAIYSVSQVTSYLRRVLERDSALQSFWIAGEVASLSRSAAGHAYFSLKEADSVLRCVVFRDSPGGHHLVTGASVVAHGRIALYEPRGDLQMIADVVHPEGMGELQMELERLKLQLGREGLFEPSRKRPLPEFPRRVGVITSPTGAVWQDITTVVAQRYPLLELVLAPTLVQGDGASEGIVEAFARLNRLPDLDAVILARGGGSQEDLWTFNEEAVARAVYSSRAPVVSAVGHETDFTIADMVADRRAPTPSAAAAMVAPDRMELATRLLVAEQALAAAARAHHSAGADRVDALAARLRRGLPDLDALRIRVDYLLRDAGTTLKHHLEVMSQQREGLYRRLATLSPRDTLRRGYSIVQRDGDGSIVTDAEQVAPRDGLRITLDRGALDAEVVAAPARSRLPHNDARTRR